MTLANTRRPLQVGYDDNGKNYVDHIALMFGPVTRLKAAPRKEPSPAFPADPLD